MSAPAPAPVAFLNDRLVPLHGASVSVFDRGFLFGDGVYELVRYFDGVGVGMDLHAQRLAMSLELARIRGFDAARLPAIGTELLAANGLADASVYLQVTRGAGSTRAHLPSPEMRPTVFAFATAAPPLSSLTGPEPVRACVLPDERWLRCEIKTISLMGNVLAAMDAAADGADEAILHRDGVVSEGSSTNVFLWTRERLVTPAAGSTPAILRGVSRLQLIDAAREEGLEVEERSVTVDELRAADEIFITSSRRLLSSVVELDGVAVGRGAGRRGGTAAPLAPGGSALRDRVGPMATRLFDLLRPRLHSAR